MTMNIFKHLSKHSKTGGILVGLWIMGSLIAGSPQSIMVHAETLQLLKTVELDVQSYVKETPLPEAFKTPTEVVQTLNATRNVALHMEIIRRAYHQLPLNSHEPFIKVIHDRHRQIADDTLRYFDHGYVQWMFRGNKAALYLLRKANDSLKNPFTNLAYAMAQAEADMNDEMASPANLTLRKQDVTYKLNDAVTQDAHTHIPGFWSSFVRVLDQLSTLEAYQEFAGSDFTLSYVPYGEKVMPHTGLVEEEEEKTPASDEPEETSSKTIPSNRTGNEQNEHSKTPSAVTSCQRSTDTSAFDFGNLYRSMSVDLDGDGVNEAVHFFYTDRANWYRVAVINTQNEVLADLHSPVAPYIMEDLDEDGVAELVVRQFKENKLQPVQVYRFDHCTYKLDEEVAAYFK